MPSPCVCRVEGQSAIRDLMCLLSWRMLHESGDVGQGELEYYLLLISRGRDAVEGLACAQRRQAPNQRQVMYLPTHEGRNGAGRGTLGPVVLQAHCHLPGPQDKCQLTQAKIDEQTGRRYRGNQDRQSSAEGSAWRGHSS